MGATDDDIFRYDNVDLLEVLQPWQTMRLAPSPQCSIATAPHEIQDSQFILGRLFDSGRVHVGVLGSLSVSDELTFDLTADATYDLRVHCVPSVSVIYSST